MRILYTYFVLFIITISLAYSQVSAPQFKCVSVINGSGDIAISWVPPADPLGQFFAYDIYYSTFQFGPYSPITSITNIAVTSYTHIGAGGNSQSRYYFIRTKWGTGGANTSISSDTLRSVFLSLTGTGTGIAKLIYNDIHTPHLNTSYPKFNIYRNKTGVAPLNLIGSINAGNYRDTINLCHVTYFYQVELKDSSGCNSLSNIVSGNFHDDNLPVSPYLDSASVLSNGQTVLGWAPSISPDCNGYIIYQVINNANIPIDTIYGINNTAYTYTNTTAQGNSLDFVVAAIDSCNNVSPLSSGQETIFLQSTYDICSKSALLKWNNIQLPLGTIQYHIYASINASSFTLIDSTSNNQYTHANLIYNSNYCYYIRAVNKTRTITTSSNRTCFNAHGAFTANFIYTRFASVNDEQSVQLAFYIDTSKVAKGIQLYRSTDNINYQPVSFIPTATTKSSYYYLDHGLNTSLHEYYYTAYIIDSCGNQRSSSNTSKTILLKTKKDNEQNFICNLDWTNYSGWPTGVSNYYIYRVVDGARESSPIAVLLSSSRTYTDNYELLYQHNGKIGYVVIAAENPGNSYGFSETSTSNISFVYYDGDIFIPNAFAPNGLNKTWKPIFQFLNQTEYHLWIYDRWGQQIFETTDTEQAWDGGTYPPDVYVYFIRYKNLRGEVIELKGSITKL